MWKNFGLKLKESFMAVFPITLVIFALIIFLVPTDVNTIILVLISAILLILGIALFSLGADNSMNELGENIGSTLSKSKKIWLMVVLSFFIGFIITFAEPDLMVLAEQVAASSSLYSVWVFIATVSLGVGIFLMFAILKLVLQWKLSTVLTICYGFILFLAFFVPEEFMPIAFDSGSVTTGPISVPFLLTFGLGLSAVRSKNSEDDSFGLIAMCSAGPILAVMILSLFLSPSAGAGVEEIVTHTSIWAELGLSFLKYVKDVALILLPIIAIFVLFQIFAFKFPKQRVAKMMVGFLFTYVGIVLFLAGVECGYLQIGSHLGQHIGALDYRWIAIPIGLMLGAFSILAEPALHVLKKQVEDITGGVLKQKVIVVVMSIGVATSVLFAVLQAMYDFSLLYIIMPVYILAIVLSFFNTKLFTAVAFDSGGVATGAMAVSFTLPFVTGLSTSASKGFGTIALIAAFPIFTMQVLGFIYKLALIRAERKAAKRVSGAVRIIEFDELDNEEFLALAASAVRSKKKGIGYLKSKISESREKALKKKQKRLNKRSIKKSNKSNDDSTNIGG
ncbi:MAG: DUF1538 domain-containing protein [Clostridia bacterium]|nr:DUF1538 domain-containing protein [Clostridia bacterium]